MQFKYGTEGIKLRAKSICKVPSTILTVMQTLQVFTCILRQMDIWGG